jgi:hypothetical protein
VSKDVRYVRGAGGRFQGSTGVGGGAGRLAAAIANRARSVTPAVAPAREAKLAALRDRVKASQAALAKTQKAAATSLQGRLRARLVETAKKRQPEVFSIRGKTIEQAFRTPPGTLRPASLAFLRGGGKPQKEFPVLMTRVRGESDFVGTDGRHRITLAREQGKKRLAAVLRELGPRGGEKRRKIILEI